MARDCGLSFPVPFRLSLFSRPRSGCGRAPSTPWFPKRVACSSPDGRCRPLDSTVDLQCYACNWILCRCGGCGCGFYEWAVAITKREKTKREAVRRPPADEDYAAGFVSAHARRASRVV